MIKRAVVSRFGLLFHYFSCACDFLFSYFSFYSPLSCLVLLFMLISHPCLSLCVSLHFFSSGRSFVCALLLCFSFCYCYLWENLNIVSLCPSAKLLLSMTADQRGEKGTWRAKEGKRVIIKKGERRTNPHHLYPSFFFSFTFFPSSNAHSHFSTLRLFVCYRCCC